MLTIRKRFTTAQVNAGATLLPAIPGLKYRLVDAYAIAVGGAMTTNTTADILATLSRGEPQARLVRAGGHDAELARPRRRGERRHPRGRCVVHGERRRHGGHGRQHRRGITVMTNLDVCVTYMIE
jgi:hypothetical protein